jgi:transposase InsO family protein
VRAHFDRIALDVLSFTETTALGHKCVLVVQDYFTKWAEAYPLVDHTSISVAHVLVHEFFARYGLPRQILSDQGGEFQSDLFREIARLMEIDQTRTVPYHPASDGMVERLNRTLIAMLAKFCRKNEEWDAHLPFVMCAYRATVHDSTNCSPSLMMFGRELTLPIDLLCTPRVIPPGNTVNVDIFARF